MAFILQNIERDAQIEECFSEYEAVVSTIEDLTQSLKNLEDAWVTTLRSSEYAQIIESEKEKINVAYSNKEIELKKKKDIKKTNLDSLRLVTFNVLSNLVQAIDPGVEAKLDEAISYVVTKFSFSIRNINLNTNNIPAELLNEFSSNEERLRRILEVSTKPVSDNVEGFSQIDLDTYNQKTFAFRSELIQAYINEDDIALSRVLKTYNIIN